MKSIFEKVAAAIKEGRTFALCTVVDTRGSTPRKPGASMIVNDDGTVEGTIGGGELERSVISEALNAINKKQTKLCRHDLLHHHGMCCGGTMDIFIEPIMKNKRLYIFGAGHTGQALARYAVGFQFDVLLVDDRKEFLDACHIEGVSKLNLSHRKALGILPFDDETYICIMTYDHGIDRDILAACVKRPHAYLGMIGSRRKVEVTRKLFRDAGIKKGNEADDIDMPMGFSIGAEGPEEIALSIMAKLLEVKNRTSAWQRSE